MGLAGRRMGTTCGCTLELRGLSGLLDNVGASLNKLRELLFPGFAPRSSSCSRRN